MHPFDMLRCEINAFMNYANFPNIYVDIYIEKILGKLA